MMYFSDGKQDSLNTVKTPCVGVCSTAIGGDVCRGCKRFSHEIIHWNGLSLDQRRAIDRRLALLLAQVMENHVRVLDASVLESSLRRFQVDYQPTHPILCWVYALLREGASQISSPTAFGFELIQADAHPSLPALKHAIDKDFYALSCAHYDRYFAQPLNVQSASAMTVEGG